MLLSSARLGESRALRWKDIDFDNQSIHVHSGLRWVQNVGFDYGDTKTGQSNRTIKFKNSTNGGGIQSSFFKMLAEYKQQQESIY